MKNWEIHYTTKTGGEQVLAMESQERPTEEMAAMHIRNAEMPGPHVIPTTERGDPNPTVTQLRKKGIKITRIGEARSGQHSSIKRLYVDNYKCLVNFELPLQELTLLVGPNGVGKTCVLSVMFALRRLLLNRAKITGSRIFNGWTPTRWQTRSIQVFELDVELESDALRYRLEVQHDRPSRRAEIRSEQLTTNEGPLFKYQSGEAQLYRDDHSEGQRFPAEPSESALARVPPRPDNTRLTRFLEFMRKVIVCGLYPAGFRAESRAEDAELNRQASNFADWYRHMSQERQDLVSDLTGALREVLEGFKGIRMEKVGAGTRAMSVVFDEHGVEYQLRLRTVSDGQRALIALYSLLHLTAGQGYTLFLDEPDNYLALAEIQPWLIALADACGDTIPQAVLCSHHPELIDYLGPDRGLLLQREASGVTVVKPLTEATLGEGLKLSERIARGWQR
ncbi:MAG: AAA family ATPase [Thermoguttaceae bacterium]|jgi:predicted ATPase